MIWFVAGINGAGKSTISTDPLLLRSMGVPGVINPDTIARRIADTRKIDYGLANISAAVLTQAMVFNEAVYSDKPNIAMETVLSTPKYQPILDIAQQRGIEVGMIYVSVRSPELSLKRIETRVAAGLHNVPEATIRKRWRGTLEQLQIWAPRLDYLIVFANNNVGGPLVRVAQKLGQDNPIKILNHDELPELTALLSGLSPA